MLALLMGEFDDPNIDVVSSDSDSDDEDERGGVEEFNW